MAEASNRDHRVPPDFGLGTRRRVVDFHREHYDRIVQRYVDVFFDDLTDAPWLDRFLFTLPKGADVLDAGCGPGQFAQYMAHKGFKVTGIDISSSMIGAATRLVSDAEFYVMDMCVLRFPARTFHGLLVAYSFPHVPGAVAERTLLDFRRVLAPRGILCLMVKLGDGAYCLPSPLVSEETCYVQLWRASDLQAALRRSGYEIVEQRTAAPSCPEELQFEKLFLLAQVVKPWRGSTTQAMESGAGGSGFSAALLEWTNTENRRRTWPLSGSS